MSSKHTMHADAIRLGLRRSLLARFAALGALAAVAGVAPLGCALPETADDEMVEAPIGEADGALYGTGTYWPTSSDGITYIDVCWNFDGDDDEKEWVRSAVEGQWGAVSGVRFTGWDRCTSSQSSCFTGIRISSGTTGWFSEVGKKSCGTDMQVDFDYVWSKSTRDFCSGQHSYCGGLIGVHEFGHALGFDHEQVRPENVNGTICDEWDTNETTEYGGDELTADFDEDSIMSYCAQWDRATPHISKGDVTGVNAAYGAKPNNVTNQVLVYEDLYYSGSAAALVPGSYNLSSTAVGNDALTSLRIPDGWSVRVYKDANQSGSYMDLTGDVGDLSDHGWNDVVSSITVTGTVDSWATAYTNTSYGGTGQKLYPGLYNMSELTIGNDTLSSISIPSGWTITLYADADFSGATLTLTSSDSSLIGDGWNDQATSIRVEGPADRTPVMVFKDSSYKGAAQELWPGRYYDDDLATVGNDALTSLVVPSGWTVWLMQNDDCYGELVQYTSSQASVSGDGFNDRTSCVVVQGP